MQVEIFPPQNQKNWSFELSKFLEMLYQARMRLLTLWEHPEKSLFLNQPLGPFPPKTDGSTK